MSVQDNPERSVWKILAVSGRIDALTSGAMETRCHAALKETPRVALDLKEVDYISSAGLRVLLSSLKLATSRNGAFALIAPQDTVREVLEMSGFAKIFQIVEGLQELA
jgi:anti-anti-sigma factor